MRFPRKGDGQLEAVLLNTAGGLADGDTLTTEVRWRRETRATVTTQAAERVYRAASDDVARVSTRITIDDDSVACWLPQETIVFDGARLARTLEIDMTSASCLVALESTVFGRRAMGETISHGRVSDRWRVLIDGRLAFLDGFLVDDQRIGHVGEYLDRGPVANTAHCVATVVVAGICSDMIADAGKLVASADCTIGASRLGGVGILRILAGDSRAMRRTLGRVVASLGEVLDFELPRVWHC